jgi:hypothetical protein
MRIKNPALAGARLIPRFSAEAVTGDATGVFDLPEEDATFLLNTPGWAVVDEEQPPPPEPEPEPTPEPEEAPQRTPAAIPGPEELAERIEALGRKRDALTLATEMREWGYDVPEDLSEDDRLRDMVEYLRLSLEG